MKNAYIFHAMGSTPEHFWYPYVKTELEKLSYSVWVPQLPNTDISDLKIQLPFVLDNYDYNKDTVLIGHSAGCPLILSLLESIDIEVKLVILVSGFVKPLSKSPEFILQKKYNWKKIKKNCKKFVFINSDNDPWGCNDEQGREMFDKLGGELIIRHGEGHMGSDSYNQPYKKFPLLVNLVRSFE